MQKSHNYIFITFFILLNFLEYIWIGHQPMAGLVNSFSPVHHWNAEVLKH